MATKAAATYCGLHEDTLRKMRTTGGGPRYARVGAAIRYDIRELDRWMAERTFASTADEAAGGAR
jgi:hypothetical protein